MPIITGANIQRFQLVTWRVAIGLEAKGMTRRGRSVTAIVRDHFKMKKGTSRMAVWQRLNEEIAKYEE
jgi:hypothetical protein